MRQAIVAQPGLPPKVDELRRRLVTAATACDYGELDRLARTAGGDFSFTFGPPDVSPGAFWRARERQGERVTANLVRVLNLPFFKQGDSYVWPSAFRDGATPQDWDAVRRAFGNEELARVVVDGTYLGYRVGISPSGLWQFFIAGD